MSVSGKRSPRTAALLTSLALGATIFAGPGGLAPVQAANGKPVAVANTATQVVTRLSTVTGPAAGGNKVLVFGTKLATSSVVDGKTVWTAKGVKWGTVDVAADKVKALSGKVLQVTVPAAAGADKYKVTVTVGDAVKGPKYTYLAPDITVTTDQDDLDLLAPTSEAGLATQAVVGTNFTKATKVLVGGKPVKGTLTGSTSIGFSYPSGLVGVQDVVVTDPTETVYVGYVTYTATEITLDDAYSPAYAIAEAASAITLTGTNLDHAATATFGTESATKPAAVKKVSATKVVVTVPKGEALEDGILTVSTKYGETDTVVLDRKVSGVPTVSGITGAGTAAGVATITGTNLIGLKAVKLVAGTKTITGSTIVVKSPTEATVKLPALTDKTEYTLTATTWNATPATHKFTVGAVAVAKPVVSSVQAADKVVTITGTALKGATKVVFTKTGSEPVTVTTGIEANAEGTSAVVTLAEALTAGTYGVVVTTPGGDSTSAELVVAAPEEPAADPTLEGVSQDAVDGGFALSLTGTNLKVGQEVRFYETNAGEGTATTITVSTVALDGSGTSGTANLSGQLEPATYKVQVRNADGVWSTAVDLVVEAPMA